MKKTSYAGYMYLILLVISFFGGTTASGATDLLKKVEGTYSKKSYVDADVVKTLKSELLGKETIHKGKIYIGNGKFRWENKTPEETLLVYDGTYIWNVQYPSKDFGGKIQVAKGKPDKKNKSHMIFLSLLGKDLSKNFKIQKEDKQKDGLVKLSIVPTEGQLAVKDLKLEVQTKDHTISALSYVDDIGNLTTLAFSNLKFKSKGDNKLFKFKPPKGAQVTDL